MKEPKIILASTPEEMKKMMQRHASDGYASLHQDSNSVTMTKRKPFNWVVAVICLFIPIIGWIALVMMILAANRGTEVIEIQVKPALA